MLSYALAIAVGISSLVLFSTAFLMSDLHRQDDFLWSGVGLFYALVLWYCAKNITGAVLLGQTAATALLVSYSWQTLKLRKAIANPAKAAEINNFSVLQSITGLLKRNKSQVKSATPGKTPTKPQVTEQEIAIPETASQPTTDEEVLKKEEVLEKTDTQAASANAPKTDTETDTETIENEQAGIEGVVDSSSKTASEVADKVTPTEKDNQTSKEQETPPQSPLPSEQTEVVTTAKNTTEENTEVKTDDSSVINSDHQSTETEIKTEEAIAKSPLDSLETVEVAEVLEAIPEDQGSSRDSDTSNIIEVTTTEINDTTEVKQTGQNQEDTNKSEDA